MRNGALAMLNKVVLLYDQYGAQGWTISLTVDGAIWCLLRVEISPHQSISPVQYLSNRKSTWPGTDLHFSGSYHYGDIHFFSPRLTGNERQTELLTRGLSECLAEIRDAHQHSAHYFYSRDQGEGVHFLFRDMNPGVTPPELRTGATAMLIKVIELFHEYGAQGWAVRFEVRGRLWFILSVSIGSSTLPRNFQVVERDISKPTWPSSDWRFPMPDILGASLHFFHPLRTGNQEQLDFLVDGLRSYIIELMQMRDHPHQFEKRMECGHGVRFLLRDQNPTGVSLLYRRQGLIDMLDSIIELSQRYGAQGWGVMMKVRGQDWFLLAITIALPTKLSTLFIN